MKTAQQINQKIKIAKELVDWHRNIIDTELKKGEVPPRQVQDKYQELNIKLKILEWVLE